MANRTYDWNGHTNLPISYPDLSDFHMAAKVRMLMRSDLDHGGVVCGARDRIMCLSKEKAYLTAEIERLRGLIKAALGFLDGEPEYHEQGMGCGLEDRGITDRYDAMSHGWEQAIEHVYAENVAWAKDVLSAACILTPGETS